jgi:tetratricopeptide (TPR) repeat protein
VVVLDDAADEAQVGPLLADVPGGVTLITSRRRLSDLTATNVAVHAFPLDVFTAAEAQAYVARAVPQIPLGDDPAAVGRLAVRCGGLPLALSLVIGHIRATPGWTVTDHADRLDERHAARRRDSEVDITLGQSYQSLPPGEQRLFRLLALHPGPDLDHHAAAALAAVAASAADALLRRLERDHLVRASGHGRFVMHDLVRAFAADKSVDEDSPAARRAALARLFGHYTAGAIAAVDRLHPAEASMRRRLETVGAPVVALPDAETARVWLDTERPVLVAVSAHAAAQGLRQYTVDLSAALYRYLVAYPDDAQQVHGNARAVARAAGDLGGEAAALIGLGVARCGRGDHTAGTADLQRALDLFRRLGDRLGEARALSNLGNAAVWQGHPAAAATHMTAALALFGQLGSSAGTANTRTNLGYIELLLGQHTSAVRHLEQALEDYRAIGNASGEAIALTNLGIAENALGNPERAVARFDRAVTLTRQLGAPTIEVHALEGLADTYTRLRQPDRAVAPLHRALDLCRQVGYRRGEVTILTVLGDVARDTGDPAAAAGYYREALATTGSTAEQQARAQAGLDDASAGRCRPAEAG